MKPTLEHITQALDEKAAAFRLVTKLQPVGSPTDKVAPPTYLADNRADKYAKEKRMVNGSPVDTVLLDSVQSQANRMEIALQTAWDELDLDMPLVQVDFPSGNGSIGRITALEAPHRLADAILRDSSHNGTPWRQSEFGRGFAQSSTKDASALLRICPTALIFGVWDSTGEAGGSGTKFARALVSEIVGFGSVLGEKTASRIDPLGIEKKAAKIYAHPTDDWTVNPEEAAKDAKGAPIPYKTSGGGNDGTPSAINHGNHPPTIDREAGGASVDYALQTTVLSLSRIRMLRFGGVSPEAARTARAYLVALGMAAIACQREDGYWLRSRCELIPIPGEKSKLQLVKSDGTSVEFDLPTAAEAVQLVSAAALAVRAAGLLNEKRQLVRLTPSEKLVELVRRSREANNEG